MSGIFWSERLQQHVGHSNHHVLAAFNQVFTRQDTNNSVTFTVQAGGTPYKGAYFSDYWTADWKRQSDYYYWLKDANGNYVSVYGSPNGKSHINSVAPTTGKAGDLITINAQVVGSRKGLSKVLFNDVEAKVKSWDVTYDFDGITDYYSTIVVWVPDLPPGDVQIKINVEGEPVHAPGVIDGADTLIHQVGNMEEFIPIEPTMYNDSALFTFHPSVPIKAEYTMQPALNDAELAYYANSPQALGGYCPNRQYRMQDIYRGPIFKGMVVMKTGRTTGTTYGIVNQPSYNWNIHYSASDNELGPFSSTVMDTFMTYPMVFTDQYVSDDPEVPFQYSNWSTRQINGMNLKMNFTDEGDSGSGVFTASYDDYVAFCNKYGLEIIVRDPDTPPDPPPGLLIATGSFGQLNDGAGGGDKAYRYVDYYGLSLSKLPMEIGGESAAGRSQMTVDIKPEWYALPNIKSKSNVGLELALVHVINLQPTPLELHAAPLDHNSINFALTDYLIEVEVHASLAQGASVGLSVVAEPAVPVELRTQAAMTILPASVGLTLNNVYTVELGSIQGPITVPTSVGLAVNSYVSFTPISIADTTSNVALSIQKGIVVHLPKSDLTKHVKPADNSSISFTLVGYSKAENVFYPILVPTNLGMSIEPVTAVQLGAAAPRYVIPSSVGVQISPSDVSQVAISVHPAVAPATKVNLELVVKLLPFFLARPDREFEVQAVINGTTYDKTMVISFDIEDSLIPSEDFVLGSVISSKLTLSLRTSDTILSNATVTPSVRLKGPEGVSDWVALGKYYIDSRGYQNNVWTFTCYDKTILSQQTYVSSLSYPATMTAVFAELCGQLGLTSDSSVVINPAYMILYEDLDISMHDMLGYIASAHGASVRLTKDTEQITFVKFTPGGTRTPILASDYFTEQQTNPLKTYTAICLTYNTDGETLTAGTGDDDHTLNIYNPYMTQAMLNTVFASFNGYSYIPFTMNWKGNPTLNVGAPITVTQRDGTTFNSVILTNKSSYKGGLKATITAPSYSPQRSETDYKGSLKQFVNSQLGKTLQPDIPYYGVTIGRANGLKIARSDGVSTATFNSDKLEIDRNGSPVFKVNDTGYVELTGVKINGGTITWGTGGANPPTAGQVGALPVGWSPDLTAYVTSSSLSSTLTSYAQTSSLVNYLTNSQLTTVLGQNYVVTGLVAANRIAVGTLDGFYLTGATVEAKNYLKVASNIWNGNTSTYGIQFGSSIYNYAIPATMKYYQGLAGDGSTFLELKGSGDCQIEVRGGWFDVYAAATFSYDVTVNGAVNTNNLSPRTGTRIYVGDYGCNFNNTSDGILRLANGAGAYLYISGSSLYFYKANGTSVALVP
ncbi:hypothetical protein [Desulfosporosinus sp. Sb-LF]|uniref:hypothetical protein n=1 Tax=Desulfosporosinus sp. Sb-LF TaxID=2560027 RepID=UPI00107F3E96|nr:hypothetical protein [Desulfosporosinus sp. Sb-LF]TGE31338.1 hypothetical protein E4K68_17950 [Desulfosporosinus sp. Sb-LF]